METLFIHPRLDEFLIIQKILTDEQILINPLKPKDYSHCELFRYLMESDNAKCLVDRNIVSYLIQLVSGMDVSKYDQSRNCFRIAAALQAFFSAAEILTEPGLAYHEYLANTNMDKAELDLSQFRSADNLNANIYLDIAMKKRDCVPLEEVIPVSPEELKNIPNIPEKLRSVEFNKTVIKKALIINREISDGYETMLCLLDWMKSDYLFNAPAFHFMSIYFGQKRISKMLKGTSLKDVENAAFDLAILHELTTKVRRDQDTLWLLASFDNAIRAVANLLFVGESGPEEYFQSLKTEYKSMWNKKNGHGEKLHFKFKLTFQEQESGTRQLQLDSRPSDFIGKKNEEVDIEYRQIFGQNK